MDFSLAGVHIIAERLVHGFRGYGKIHPFDIFFFLFLLFLLARAVGVFQGIDGSGQSGRLAHHCLAGVCPVKEDTQTQQA